MAYETAHAKMEFDRWSAHYDRDVLQHCFFRPAHELLLQNLTAEDRRILDIGCGTGKFAARALERFPDTQVWGMDLSGGMLGQCRERCDASGGRLHLVQGDSQRLPFQDNAFDVITCTHSFHHYPQQRQVVQEMHRVLRPGGRLLIIDGDRDGWWGWMVYDIVVVMMEGAVRHLSSRAFRHMYASAGFDNLSQQRRGNFLPFLLTVGEAVKPAVSKPKREAA